MTHDLGRSQRSTSTSGPFISGFMIVRDVESQGYPFIEAARSALSVCDELLVSDGCSSDRTWEGLLALEEAYGDRIRLFRDPWPGPENRGGALARATNVVRRRCLGDYCFSVQANEIVPEEVARQLRELPRAFPKTEIFAFAYVTIMGTNIVWTADHRRRLFRNIPDIAAVGDAFDVGELLHRRSPTLLVQLAQPVFRYRAPSPAGYLSKLETVVPRTRVWARELELAREALSKCESEPDAAERVASFWGHVRKYLDEELWRVALEVPRGCIGTIDRHPSVMAHLIGRWSYDMGLSLESLRSSLGSARHQSSERS